MKIPKNMCTILRKKTSDRGAQATIRALPRMSWERAEALSSSRVRIMMIIRIIMGIMMVMRIIMIIMEIMTNMGIIMMDYHLG